MICLDFSWIDGKSLFIPASSSAQVREFIAQTKKLPEHSYYLKHEGRSVYDPEHFFSDGVVQIVPRLLGGKGGFGSMLRAIGAQIEKTTNREACRDLSGRRLRDINEEQRLKTWISQQSEREKEAEERKKKKMEKLASEPRHEFKDESYEAARSQLSEKLHESVEQGFTVSTGLKRSAPEDKKPKKKIRSFLLCSDEELSSEESGDESSQGPSTSKDNQVNPTGAIVLSLPAQTV